MATATKTKKTTKRSEPAVQPSGDLDITCDRASLLTALRIASAAAPMRSPRPILAEVKLQVTSDTATLMATDLEQSIRLDFGGVQVNSPGSVMLTRKFMGLLELSDSPQVSLRVDRNTLTVRDTNSEVTLNCEHNANEFPAVQAFAASSYHGLPARLLKSIVQRTAFATDHESTRFALGGDSFEFTANSLTAIATDGRRLAAMRVPVRRVGKHKPTDNTTIVYTRTLRLLEQVIGDEEDAEIRIAFDAHTIRFCGMRFTISARLIEGRFPKWRDVLRERKPEQITVNAGQLLAVTRKAGFATNDEQRGVDYTFSAGTLSLSAKTCDHTALVRMPLSYSGPDLSITLNPGFLAEFLQAIGPDKLCSIDIANEESAAIFSTLDGYEYVLMPLARG